MKKQKNYKQITASALLFLAGLFFGLAVGLLLIPKEQQVPISQLIPPKDENTRIAADLIYPTVLGNPEAKVHLTEFSDFECEYCERYYRDVFTGPIKEYLDAGQITYTYKAYLINSYRNNLDAAFFAYCSGEQNLFWEMYAKLHQNHYEWAGQEQVINNFEKYSDEIGLDRLSIAKCLSSQKYLPVIQNQIEEGKNLDVKAIPTVFVNDIKIEGLQSADYYKQVIDAEIQRTSLLDE